MTRADSKNHRIKPLELSEAGKLKRAVRMALWFGAAAPGLAFAQTGTTTPAQPAQGDQPTQLEAIEVTGSRISRAQMENSLPVTVISREQLVNSGVTTVADAVRASTFNSFGSYSQISGSSYEGAALVDLRGLGSDRTLVLLNGHRVATASATQGAGVDLNMIPLAAVERVEILQDGASAIYGSDAIAGVVNVILKKDFNGTQVSYSRGNPTMKGGEEEAASIVGGMSSGSNRVMFGATMTSKGIIWLRDRDYTRANLGDGVNYSTTSGINEAGNTVFNSTFTDIFPAPAGACEAPGLARYIDDVGIEIGVPGKELCTFNYTTYAADTRSLRTSSLFASFQHDINSDWDVNIEGVYGSTKSFGRFAPSPALLFVPASAPTNPYGQDIYIYHRYIALGARDDVTMPDVFSLFGSVKGQNVGPGRIELGAAYSVATNNSYGYDYVLKSVAAAAAAAGDYDPFNLANPGSAATINSMKVTINRRGQTEAREAFANYSLDLFPLAGGSVQTVIGAEARKERFYDIYDSQSEAGTVGGSAGNSARGERSAYAVYDELLLPILSELEADLAVRYDHYTDVGGKFTPKLSVRYNPTKMLTLRGAVGKGFRAPLLSELNANDASDAPVARDFVACRNSTPPVSDASCPETQYDGWLNKANKNLKPEESRQFGFGVVVQPADWIDASLDYWNIQLTDAISTPTLQEEILREANGQPLTPGAQINRTPSGGIDQTTPGFATTFNYLKVNTDGLDLNVNTNFEMPNGMGRLLPKLQVSYMLNTSADDGVLPEQNGAGFAATNTGAVQGPHYRASGSVDWMMNAVGVTWNMIYIPGTYQTEVTDPTNPLKVLGAGHTASNFRNDVQVRYNHPWNGTIAVGCRDLFNRGVSINPTLDSPYYAQGMYDPTGRIPYVRYTQNF